MIPRNRLNRKTLISFAALIIAAAALCWYFGQPVSVPVFSANAQTYTVKGNGEYPKFLEAVIDPLDVKVGDTQEMLVRVEDPVGIDWVKAEIEHDEGTDEVILEPTKEENAWFGKWKVHSTHSETYHTTFIVQNKEGEQNSVVLAWTDPCSIPNNASPSWTLDGNCSVSGIDGVDNGDLVIDNGYTLTIQDGATFAWNDGNSIIINDGSIVINDGGELKKTNLWVTGVDADEDGYYAEGGISDQIATTSSPGGGYTRKYLFAAGDDCCDSDPDAHPGATSYHGSVNECGSWDWNCDGYISQNNCTQITNCYGTAPCDLGCGGYDNYSYDTTVLACGTVFTDYGCQLAIATARTWVPQYPEGGYWNCGMGLYPCTKGRQSVCWEEMGLYGASIGLCVLEEEVLCSCR